MHWFAFSATKGALKSFRDLWYLLVDLGQWVIFRNGNFKGFKEKWAVTTVEVRGTLPGNARERGATTMCSAANVEQGGVEKLATSEEEVAGEKLLIKKERHALESE